MWRGWKARPNQLEPEGDWLIWLVMAGRGFGKSRTGAEWVQEKANAGIYGRWALVAETAADARDVMVEGISGVLNIGRPDFRPKYEPSKRRLTWPNGAIATLYSADDPDQLRGPEHDAFWADEVAKWRYPDSWDQLMFGLRVPGRQPPRGIATTTPRPIPVIKQLISQDNVRITKGSTLDNAANLAPSFLKAIIERYEGTRLGRQEINAEILDDLPGALWTREILEDAHVKERPKLVRTVVAVDPSGASTAPKKGEKDKADDIGIIIVGKGEDGRCYVLGDYTCNLSPDGWGRRVVQAFDDFNADRIIAEANFGGGMVEHVIRSVRDSVPVRIVKTGIGKAIRAEPVAGLYEQRRVRHCGVFAKLEDQMCLMASDGYVGKGSPDRVDALVWAVSELMFKNAIAAAPIVIPFVTSVKSQVPGSVSDMEAPRTRRI